jgi:hypothetical protein
VGSTWQLNALGVLTHLSNPDDTAAWDNVLAHVKQDAPSDQVISPYFNLYLLDAMTMTGHKQQALDWLRTYWGGMLAEGATSFWESYDLRWPKTNFHLSLQADGTSGYFVSLMDGPLAQLRGSSKTSSECSQQLRATIPSTFDLLCWASGSLAVRYRLRMARSG